MNTRYRVLVSDPLHADGIELLASEADFEVVQCAPNEEAELTRQLPTIDGWIVRSGSKVRAEHLEQAPRLQVVARAGVGVDNIDVAAATRAGVLVMNAPDANAITTAELAIGHLLSLSRHLVAGDRMVRTGKWQRKQLVGSEVAGKTLGIIGLGRIGRHVATRALGLGMRVLGHDPYVNAAALGSLDLELCDFEQILAQSDYLTLHAPLNQHTRGLLDAAAFARMKPGLRLINCARGALIVEADLQAALQDGRLGAAALDVFADEPPAADHPLLQLPNVVCTPHLGASTEEASRKVALAVAEQVRDYLTQKKVSSAVNLSWMGSEPLDQLQPYLELVQRAGRFLAQVVDGPLETIHAEYRGSVADLGVEPLTMAFLQGLLQSVLDGPVNLVNARVLATERGWSVTESRSSQLRDFESLVSYTVTTARGPRSIGATLFGRRMPRLVLLDDARTEIIPEGHLLVLRNQDEPGIIGTIGTLLGKAGINIGNMHVSVPAADGLCFAVLGLSEPIDAEVAAAIRDLQGIQDVRMVDLT